MGAAYKCDFCGKTFEGAPPEPPTISRIVLDEEVEIIVRESFGVRPDPNGYDICPRCQQAILRALADAVEVEG